MSLIKLRLLCVRTCHIAISRFRDRHCFPNPLISNTLTSMRLPLLGMATLLPFLKSRRHAKSPLASSFRPPNRPSVAIARGRLGLGSLALAPRFTGRRAPRAAAVSSLLVASGSNRACFQGCQPSACSRSPGAWLSSAEQTPYSRLLADVATRNGPPRARSRNA